MKTTLTIEQSAELIKRGVSADKASKRVTRQVADSRGREIEKLRLKRWKDCVPYEKATMINLHVGLMRFEHKEIFTLADLLSLLPKEIKRDSLDRPYVLHIIREEDRTIAAYRRDWDSITGADKRTSEFIDSLYELLLWAIDHNHVKLD